MSSPTQKEFKGTDRFSINRRLGEGGFGVVYEAYDRERNALVALKTLKSALYQSGGAPLYRFKREFRSLADITHKNLAALYELLSDGDQWFFTMELVDGIDIIQYLRQCRSNANPLDAATPKILQRTSNDAVTKALYDTMENTSWETQEGSLSGESGYISYSASFDAEQLRPTFVQLVEGVCSLHDMGKLHRDIKPTNVLVEPNGRVVLLDFGLVIEIAPEGYYHGSEVIGTPTYVSPEQASGHPIWEATDWYSVGAVLFEALTGRPPFLGKFYDVIRHKKTFEANPPSAFMSGVPEDLDELCSLLLRRDPHERPNGREILRKLGASDYRKKFFIPDPSQRTAPLVGRDRHLAALKEAFDATKEGRAVTVFVHGNSGVGKSALVRKFLDDLVKDDSDAVALSGRCYEQESVPYKTLDSLIDSLSQFLKELPTSAAEALMPPDVLALARLFPVLRQVAAVAKANRKAAEIPDAQELRRRAFTAMRELLERLADARPLALFIDDLQWGDADSADLLGELLHPPDPPPLLLICSYRNGEADSGPLLKALSSIRNAAASPEDIREIVVEELSIPESKELALSILGGSKTDLETRSESIARESGGNPFFINELAHYSHMDGADASEIRLDNVIQTRVSQLPEDARRLLNAVAVAGCPMEMSLCRRVVGADIDENKILTLLRARHMLRISGSVDELMEIYHDRIRETIMSNLPSEDLLRLHTGLAESLEAAGQADPERLAVHFKEAGFIDKAARYAIAAAERASNALAFKRAARLYKLALDLERPASEGRHAKVESDHTPNVARRSLLQVKLADSLAKAGNCVEAARAYLEATENAAESEKIELRRRAAEQFLFSNHTEEGLTVIQDVLDAVGMKLPKTPQRALLSYLGKRVQIKLRGLDFHERTAEYIPTEELLRIEVCWSVAMGLAIVEPIRGADFQARHLLLSLRAGEPFRIARALALEAGYSSASGGRTSRRSEMLLQRAREIAERIGHPYALGFVALQAGAVAFFEGRIKDTAELCENAAEILSENCTGVVRELDNARCMILFSYFYMGRLQEVTRNLPPFFKEIRERGGFYGDATLTRLAGIANLMADNVEAARRSLLLTEERWSHKDFLVHHYHTMIIEAEISLYSGEGLAAWERLNEQWHAFAHSLLMRVQCILIESHYTHARCALAAAAEAKDPSSLLHIAERDAEKIDSENMPWGAPLSLLIKASVAAARKERNTAISLLAAAETGFETENMHLFAAAARRRRGLLIGGPQGDSLIQEVSVWMAERKVKDPERFTNAFAPGLW